MKKQIMMIGLVIVLMFSLPLVIFAQDPRPTVPPRVKATEAPTTGGGSVSGSTTSSIDTSNANCASVYGVTLNWGFGNQSNVGLQLGHGDWQVNQLTANDGDYRFGNLGRGIGILSVNPGTENLTPMVDNAAVRLTCDFHTQANIGLYSGSERPTPPATVSMSVSPQTISPGETATVMFKLNNTLPTGISHVILTDLFPAGLTIDSVNASKGTVDIVDNMLTIMVGEISSESEESVAVILRAADTLESGTELQNTATLFYAESAADQDHMKIMVGEGSKTDSEMVTADMSASATDSNADPTNELTTTTDEATTNELTTNETTSNETTTDETTTSEAAANESADNTQDDTVSAADTQSEVQSELNAATNETSATDTELAAPETLPVTGLGFSFSFIAVLLIIFTLVGRGMRSVKGRAD